MEQFTPDTSVSAAFISALEWWESMGVEVPKTTPAKPKARTRPAPTSSQLKQATTAAKTTTAPTAPDPTHESRMQLAKQIAAGAKDLAALKTAMSSFDAGTLSDNATQCVFASGNPAAKLMVIGDAPNREEDTQGIPFAGRPGQLLSKMLAAIGLTETEFYAANVINWRPPGNRTPTAEEIALCRPFLHRHITLAAPDILLIMGGVPLSAMTELTSIMKNRGSWQTITINGRDIPALPIYHPSFLLKRPELKREAWRDLLSLHEKLSEL